jgi:hypothetical protein
MHQYNGWIQQQQADSSSSSTEQQFAATEHHNSSFYSPATAAATTADSSNNGWPARHSWAARSVQLQQHHPPYQQQQATEGAGGRRAWLSAPGSLAAGGGWGATSGGQQRPTTLAVREDRPVGYGLASYRNGASGYDRSSSSATNLSGQPGVLPAQMTASYSHPTVGYRSSQWPAAAAQADGYSSPVMGATETTGNNQTGIDWDKEVEYVFR